MGCYEGWTHPNGFYANGLLPHESDSVTRLLDPDRWSMAEETTAELIACVQPNQLSEERRNAVASYVIRLIGSCFSCQVFTFGSVPLKTYLPDGDIDLTAFGNETLKDTWATEVRDMLEKEGKNDDAEFCVKEVQYIQAEVKLVKCLVDNIVVDISFNQLGGLCTLCFLEEVDSLVNQNHLFKRSIILIKAWCYYESRILGAHHGLISTYALETLVLYIFHVFNNSFAGPLEVLYRFLEFFSKFDWDRFCVSLWGPVPISLLPDMTADPPRKDGGELLLSKGFLDACSSVYSAFPTGQENQELPFVSKHFNVIDPLRTNNNLGRSVSKGNFFRIRSAFSYGAQRLAKLLDCPKEDITAEVSQFFMNTMERHGRGPRPDIPKPAVYGLQSFNRKQIDGTNSLRNSSSKKNVKQNSADHESEVEKTGLTQDSHGGLSRLSTQPTGRVSRSKNMTSVSHKQTQKTDVNLTSTTSASQNNQVSHGRGLNENANTVKGRSSRADNFGNEIHATARNPFARTHSSPELKDTSNQYSSQGRSSRTSERTKAQILTRLDHGRSRNLGAEVSESSNAVSSPEDVSSLRHSSINERIHESRESNVASNRYHDGSGSGLMNEDRSIAEAMQMQQEEQDLVNMMASSSLHNFNGNFHVPMNLASHLPIPMSPSVLASLGHAYRNSAGMGPTNFSFESTPWGPNMHYPQGLMTFPMSQYFSSLGMAPKQQGIVEPVPDDLIERETFKEDSDQGLWSDREMDSVRGLDVDSQMLEEHKHFVPGVHPGRIPGSRVDKRGFSRENFGGIPQHQNTAAGNDTYGTIVNSVGGAHGTSKVKESSEASSDGSSLGRPGPMTYQQGRKFAPSVDRSAIHENGWQHESELVDHVSSRTDDDSGDWVPPSSMTGKEIRDTISGAVSSSNVRVHDIPGHELAQLNGSKTMLPMPPMLVNPALCQRTNDNNDNVPLTFYPTGPPVPFVTMLPFYNFPTEKGVSDLSANHVDRGERFIHSRISQFDEKVDSTENPDEIENFSCSSSAKGAKPVELSEEQKSDILNSDFASHWQNLQYGRVCQNPRDYGPVLYPPSVVVPPAFMQGQSPFDNTDRPLSANAQLFTQIMGYGSRLNPVSPLQPGSTRPLSNHGPYGDEVARYRSGTGTYLPHPAPFRERPPSNRNRGNYSYDRNDHHGDREGGNWKLNSRQRYSGRGRGRNQFDRANTRTDRASPSNSRADRPWNTFKSEQPVPSMNHHSQNTPFSSSTSTQSGSSNVPYGMYPLQVVNRDGGPPGAASPPFLMLYHPYEQNMVYGSAEQLEFGSHGVPFSGMNEMMQQLGEDSFQNMQRNYHRVNSAQSSPDTPSSPKLPR